MIVRLDEAYAEEIGVVPLSDGLYRLDETPNPFGDTELEFGDIFAAELADDGSLRVVGLVEKSSWSHSWLGLSEKAVASAAFDALTEAIDKAGGVWELIMGGLLLCHVPHGSTLNVDHAWASAVRTYGEAPSTSVRHWTVTRSSGTLDLEARFGPRH